MGISDLIKKNEKLYKKLIELSDLKRYHEQKRLVKTKGAKALINKLYFGVFSENPDLENPKTFNEKLQWLKLNWYDEKAFDCCNKHKAREFVKSRGLEKILMKQYAVYTDPNDIDISKLPEKFVLKPSHDSGHVIICTDKSKFDEKKAKRDLKKWLKVDYEYMSGEWPYCSEKFVVCEEFLEDKKNDDLFDYKFFCFNGKPEYIFFASDRKNHVKSDFYDLNWEKQSFRWYYEPSDKVYPKPERFDEMVKYAKILSEGFPFMRVDFYEVNGKVYFGELTLFHGGGLGWFKPAEIDRKFGDMITLPEKSTPSPWERILGK